MQKRLTSHVTRNKVKEILNKLGKSTHYLMSKPISKWVKTDKLNWNALIRNTRWDNFSFIKPKLKWKKVGRKQWQSVSKNKKFDFTIDARKGIALNVFNHRIKNVDESHIDSISLDSIEEAKIEAENWINGYNTKT